MQCPFCEADSQVTDSRRNLEGEIRRRRVCTACRRRFTTYERLGNPNLRVSKRRAKAEPFSSEKLQRALLRVCRHRPSVRPEDIARVARDIEAELLDSGRRVVASETIAELALDRLSDLDAVSYRRLLANYLDEDEQLRLQPESSESDDPGQLTLFVAEPHPPT